MITKKFSSKPALLEAAQWFVTKTPSDDAKPFVDWINRNGGSAYFVYDFNTIQMRHEPRISILSKGSSVIAKPGDWITLDHYGNFWAYDPAVFKDFAFEITEESYQNNPVIALDPNTPPQVGME